MTYNAMSRFVGVNNLAEVVRRKFVVVYISIVLEWMNDFLLV